MSSDGVNKIEFCPSSDDNDDPLADTPPEEDEGANDPLRAEWMRAVDAAKHGMRTERMGKQTLDD